MVDAHFYLRAEEFAPKAVQQARRRGGQGEYVDVASTVEQKRVESVVLFQKGVEVAELGEGKQKFRIRGRGLHGIVLGRGFFGKYADKPAVVAVHHFDIHVVVPGNESPVAHGAYQGSGA